MTWRAVHRPPGSARPGSDRRGALAEPPSSSKVSKIPYWVSLILNAYQVTVPGSAAARSRPPSRNFPKSSPLPGLASSNASTPNVGLMSTPRWMSPTYVSKRLIGSGGAATLSIVSDVDVAVLAVDGCFDSGLSAVVDVLATANALRQDVPGPPPAFTVTIVGLTKRVRTGNGLTVDPVPARKMAQPPDLLVMPALGVKTPARSSTSSAGTRHSTSSVRVVRTVPNWPEHARDVLLGRVRHS